MRRAFLPAFAVAALALLPAAPAHAYQFISTFGCSPGTGAGWKEGTTWYLNGAGYSRLSFSAVETATKAGVGVWSQPCCSAFESTYLGTATETALDSSAKNVLSFAEDAWPRELGSSRSTIAVTLTQARSNCSIATADMVFNGVGFTFRIGADTDLQAIATHEFGHWLGLDHSNSSGSTMLPYYQGGTTGRQLGSDDQAGVCAIYPGWCGSCSGDDECPDGRKCADGMCVTPPCKVNADCDQGSFCASGSCVPGCRTHLECAEDESCLSGRCTPRVPPCTICGSCTDNSDCGSSQSYSCAELSSGENVCTKSCGTDDDCDGDSVCQEVRSGRRTLRRCFAPSEAGGGELCPSNYTCIGKEPPAALACPKLWDLCPSGADGCGGRSDYCVPTGLNAKCSCTCRSDDECGEDAHCLTDPGTGTPACYPATLVDPCGNTFCAPGAECRDDVCVPTCGGHLCERNEVCVDGECQTVCEEACPEGTSCDAQTRTCEPVDRCEGMICASGTRCVDGACVAGGTCENVSCPDGSVCLGDACVADGASASDGGCSGCTAGDGGLSLLGVLALGALLGRRRR